VKWREHAELLLRKAAQDEYLLDRMLDDPAAPTEAFGFHAQQAAEKMLKAALAVHQSAYPRTHRLADLLDALRTAGVAIPRALSSFGT
jgi:HEPN domain-containing protein